MTLTRNAFSPYYLHFYSYKQKKKLQSDNQVLLESAKNSQVELYDILKALGKNGICTLEEMPTFGFPTQEARTLSKAFRCTEISSTALYDHRRQPNFDIEEFKTQIRGNGQPLIIRLAAGPGFRKAARYTKSQPILNKASTWKTELGEKDSHACLITGWIEPLNLFDHGEAETYFELLDSMLHGYLYVSASELRKATWEINTVYFHNSRKDSNSEFVEIARFQEGRSEVNISLSGDINALSFGDTVTLISDTKTTTQMPRVEIVSPETHSPKIIFEDLEDSRVLAAGTRIRLLDLRAFKYNPEGVEGEVTRYWAKVAPAFQFP